MKKKGQCGVNQKVSSSKALARPITLGLCSSPYSEVMSPPAVVSRSVTMRLDASLAMGFDVSKNIFG